MSLSQLRDGAVAGQEVVARWAEALEHADPKLVRRLCERLLDEFRKVIKTNPSQEELRASFGRQLEIGGPVTRAEVAAWHRTTLRQVDRWQAAGLLVKLPERGRKTIFDSRVASRLRPTRREG